MPLIEDSPTLENHHSVLGQVVHPLQRKNLHMNVYTHMHMRSHFLTNVPFSYMSSWHVRSSWWLEASRSCVHFSKPFCLPSGFPPPLLLDQSGQKVCLTQYCHFFTLSMLLHQHTHCTLTSACVIPPNYLLLRLPMATTLLRDVWWILPGARCA